MLSLSLSKGRKKHTHPPPLIGGVGNRMHHKFLVIDFDKPTARVYLGSYNFSSAADVKNGDTIHPR